MNNKFYVIEISEGDSKIEGKGIYEYATLNEAKASYHKKLGVAMGSELYTREQIVVTDSYNSIYCSEVYEKEEQMPIAE